ncbi:MAG: tetratricopeptide repeat protein [Pseudomonadales bacterium]
MLTRLRRRKVLRIAGAYAVVAWGVLQVADLLFPRLGLPDWTFTFVAALLAIGLPITVAVAWTIGASYDGIQGTPDSLHAPRHDETTGRRWIEPLLVIILLVVVGVTAVQVLNRERPSQPAAVPTPAGEPSPSVAVLPFASFSADAEDGYFADGLTEELINGLAQIDGLRVPGRTSSFHYKNLNVDLRDIGRELSVAHVVEGSVRRAGDRLRVTVQLVATGDGFHLWSQTYDRNLEDVFAIQQDIARQVARQLRQTLFMESSVPAVTESDSYPAYLVATAMLREHSLRSLTRAREMFEALIERDPDDVEALAGYARATMPLAAAFLTLDFETAAAEAVGAVEHALEVEPDSAAANLAAGNVYSVLAFRTGEQRYYTLAERALARAVDLAPDDPDVLRGYGSLLQQTGRAAPALEVIRKGAERDPMNRAAQLHLAEAYRGVGQLADARTLLESVIEREPDYVAARLELGELFIEMGQLDAALPHLRVAHESKTTPRATFALANVLLNLHRREEMRRVIGELDYAPQSMPLGSMVLQLTSGDDSAALAYARGELERTGDRIFRPVIVVLALNTADLVTARAELRAMEPTVLLPGADVRHLQPDTVLFAANLLMREGATDQAHDLLESLLTLLSPEESGFDPIADKILRAQTYAQLGRGDEALAELGAARTQGYRTLYDFDLFLRLDRYPAFASLDKDPRFRAFVDGIDQDNQSF